MLCGIPPASPLPYTPMCTMCTHTLLRTHKHTHMRTHETSGTTDTRWSTHARHTRSAPAASLAESIQLVYKNHTRGLRESARARERVRRVRRRDKDKGQDESEACHVAHSAGARRERESGRARVGGWEQAGSMGARMRGYGGRRSNTCLRARSKSSRTRAAPRPTNISTKSEPEQKKKGTLASAANTRASNVFPV